MYLLRQLYKFNITSFFIIFFLIDKWKLNLLIQMPGLLSYMLIIIVVIII